MTPVIPRRPRPTTNPRLTRRGLITSGVLAGVLAATGVPVIARSRSGTLRLALPALPAGFHPGPQDLAARVAGAGAIFETLTEIAATGEVQGELARSWEVAESGRLWTFALRPARFHDASPVTSDDVAQSLMRHADPASPAAWLLARIADIATPSPDRITLRLTHPDADLPLLLADPHLVIAPDGRIEYGIGSGLYRAAGAGAVFDTLIRLPHHWKDGRAGWFDRIAFLATPYEADRLALLAAGEVDAAPFASLPPALPPGLSATRIDAALSLALAPPSPPGAALVAARLAPDRGPAFAALEADLAPPPPHVILHTARLLHTDALGNLAPLDSARIAERWWFA
jgi:peptide/nickel transport system substrate-binding protein